MRKLTTKGFRQGSDKLTRCFGGNALAETCRSLVAHALTLFIHIAKRIKLMANASNNRTIYSFEWEVCIGVCKAVVQCLHFVFRRRIQKYTDQRLSSQSERQNFVTSPLPRKRTINGKRIFVLEGKE